MLPFCSDEQLLAELAGVVSAGWDLPSRPKRAKDVRHLLLLADTDTVAYHRQRAQRLLTMIGQALARAAAADELGEDEHLGLRILLGLHPDYRSGSSPVIRREAAAVYLVPAWHDNWPDNPAETFLRRHQEQALRQVLVALRQVYGQEPGQADPDVELLRMRRWYVVDERRQVSRLGGEEVLRVRHDDFDMRQLYEARHTDLGFVSSSFRLVPTETGPSAQVADVRDGPPEFPDEVQISIVLNEALQAGQEFSLAWEEEVIYGADASRWQRYFVSTQVPNGLYDLTLRVRFLGERPEAVWWLAVNPRADLNRIQPDTAHIVEIDEAGEAVHHWSDTQRTVEYGLQWTWADEP